MRISAPPAFEASFDGPEGRYQIRYAPTGDWDGVLDVAIGGLAMRWGVKTIETDGATTRFCGMTTGTKSLWNDVFWFEMLRGDRAECIRYWADRVVWREDPASVK